MIKNVWAQIDTLVHLDFSFDTHNSRGRKEMLCGNCNGAGFIGGFLSTYDQ